ncbi:MAG: hypothetical protein ACOYVK_14240 [Bacillota bacterium]
MSRFLGPIHYWLFNKIQLHEKLEVDLVSHFEDKYGDEIGAFTQQMTQRFGSPIGDKPLEALIDQGNIHGWLQERITIAETRHAAILTQIFDRYGQEAINDAISIYAEQGNRCGMDARDKEDVDNAMGLYKALNNYILEGMPCDNVNNITTAEPDKLEWDITRCLHRRYWDEVNANPEVFYGLRAAWVKAFIEGANSAYTYQVQPKSLRGETIFTHQILKK